MTTTWVESDKAKAIPVDCGITNLIYTQNAVCVLRLERGKYDNILLITLCKSISTVLHGRCL